MTTINLIYRGNSKTLVPESSVVAVPEKLSLFRHRIRTAIEGLTSTSGELLQLSEGDAQFLLRGIGELIAPDSKYRTVPMTSERSFAKQVTHPRGSRDMELYISYAYDAYGNCDNAGIGICQSIPRYGDRTMSLDLYIVPDEFGDWPAKLAWNDVPEEINEALRSELLHELEELLLVFMTKPALVNLLG